MSGLSNEEATALSTFRTNVKGVVTPEQLKDDAFLLRWLRARDFDLTKSEKMLRDSMQWRKNNDIDNLLSTYKTPEVIEKYFSIGFLGVDKTGCPIILVRLGNIDGRGILSSIRVSEAVQYMTYTLEKTMKMCEEETAKLGKPVHKLIAILDAENLSMKVITFKPVITFFRVFMPIFDSNYPEVLKLAIVPNASRVLYLGYSLIKNFISPATNEKIKIYGQDKWKNDLLEHIDAEVLPVHWGGTRTDGSGKPWCPKLIVEGGPVPEKYIANPGRKLADVEGVDVLSVSSGSSALVEAEIKESRSILKWIFGTEGHDIEFGVYRMTSEGLEEHLPKERVTSHLIAEEGELECVDVGTYVLAFDNSASLMRSKKVKYRVEVLPPEEGVEFTSASL